MNEFIPYDSLKHNYKNSWQIPYSVLLNTIEWRDFRESILKRDNYKCTICKSEQSEKIGRTYVRKLTEAEISNYPKEIFVDLTGEGFIVKLNTVIPIGKKIDNPTILHVHHEYYIFGHAPWEYKLTALKTVCHECHHVIHKSYKIPVFIDESRQESIELTPCSRCNGTGFLEEYHYFQNGICFKCEGRKFEEFVPK